MPAVLDKPQSRIWTPPAKRIVHPWTSRDVCEICNRRQSRCDCEECDVCGKRWKFEAFRRKPRCCCFEGGSSTSSGSSTDVTGGSSTEYSYDPVFNVCTCDEVAQCWLISVGGVEYQEPSEPWDEDDVCDCCDVYNGDFLVKLSQRSPNGATWTEPEITHTRCGAPNCGTGTRWALSCSNSQDLFRVNAASSRGQEAQYDLSPRSAFNCTGGNTMPFTAQGGPPLWCTWPGSVTVVPTPCP